MSMDPSMRLKVKGDTFFLPNPNGGVYFRNNLCSFQMEGDTIYQWIEKLMPVFNGEHTLEDLTDGLPNEYQDRVYDLAEILLQKGFVRDVSQDHPHQLSEQIFRKYNSQIEFLDNISDSGAYRFQSFRQAKVLAVGSGPFFVSLASALLESGLPKFHMLITDSVPTNRERLIELETHAHKTDFEVALTEITLQKVSSWREAILPFDAVLYVSQEDNIEELRVLHAICREEKKLFIPAICLDQVGIAGPLVHPDSEGCWESAWRRLHQPALCKETAVHAPSSTAEALLANVLAFELFKTVTGATESELKHKAFLLDLETLEGNWHSFIPHPLITGWVKMKLVQNNELWLEPNLEKRETNELLPFFSQLTAKETGIFHVWGAEDSKQLPLAECHVKVADPLSEGPAELLPDIICTGLTHEEAQRAAGLAGIEAYVSRMANLHILTLPSDQQLKPNEFIGIGAGETIAEGISRGLQMCLAQELDKQQIDQNSFSQVELNVIEDKRCQFYLQALTTLQGTPIIALGENVVGFPVVWVGTKGDWFRSIGFNITLALQNVLQQALAKSQNQTSCSKKQSLKISSVYVPEKVSNSMEVPACEKLNDPKILQSAMQILKQHGKQALIFNLELEPFFKEALAGVFGVVLREEESQ